MPKENIKSFTIRDARFEDIDKFNDIKDRKRLTAGGVFEQLLDGTLSVNTNNSNENAADYLDLKEKHEARLLLIDQLKQENEALLNEIKALNQKDPEKVTIEIEKKLTGTQFIFEPDQDLAKKMHRCITYNIKQGKMNRVSQDLPAQFTKVALNYFIKNEYNHILK